MLLNCAVFLVNCFILPINATSFYRKSDLNFALTLPTPFEVEVNLLTVHLHVTGSGHQFWKFC